MSLADLPDVLIAHLTTYLSYEDTCNVMETSKKNYRAIKGYGKDKMKLQYIRFYMEETPITFHHCEIILNEKNKFYRLKEPVDTNDKYTYIKNVLAKCQSVNYISFPKYCRGPGGPYELTKPLVEIMYKTKAHIRSVIVNSGKIDLSLDEFVYFCRKFKDSRFDDCQFKFNIFNDEIFVKVLPYAVINYFRDIADHSLKFLTDRTLVSLKNRKNMDNMFLCESLTSSFTVEQIVENLETIRASNTLFVSWNLGTLQSNQLDDADRYFNKENEELNEFWDLRVVHFQEHPVKYELTKKDQIVNEHPWFHITFRVARE